MIPYPHQIRIAREQAYPILKQYGIVYLAMEERTGKTLTAILTIEESTKVQSVLVVTTKKGLEGWEDTILAYKPRQSYTLINYDSIHKVVGDFNLIILDEPHTCITTYPKPSLTWKKVKKFTWGKPIIYLDATPSAQSLSQLFNTFALSSYSPWKAYKSFYAWFTEYGIPKVLFLGGRQVIQYHQTNEEKIRYDTNHLFISYTRAELGFTHEPNDELHYIDLYPQVRTIYNTLLKERIYNHEGIDIVCDSTMKLRTVLHQLEGGTIKEVGNLGNCEKVGYILKTWGDTKDLVIMYEYQLEEKLLTSIFKEARILQATSWAAGVDLSNHETVVVYSMNFSTANHTQRRARQCNMKRATPITVHYLLVKDAISEQVYNTVALNKTNFVDAYFNQKEI